MQGALAAILFGGVLVCLMAYIWAACTSGLGVMAGPAMGMAACLTLVLGVGLAEWWNRG